MALGVKVVEEVDEVVRIGVDPVVEMTTLSVP